MEGLACSRRAATKKFHRDNRPVRATCLLLLLPYTSGRLMGGDTIDQPLAQPLLLSAEIRAPNAITQDRQCGPAPSRLQQICSPRRLHTLAKPAVVEALAASQRRKRTSRSEAFACLPNRMQALGPPSPDRCHASTRAPLRGEEGRADAMRCCPVLLNLVKK